MKRLIIKVLPVLAIIFTAHASIGAETLAELKTHPGMMGPPFAQTVSILILDDGQVVRKVQRHDRNRTVTESLVATLEPQTLANLFRSVSSISDGELVDLNAGEPQCMDAPSTELKVRTPLGKDTPVFRWAMCHEFKLKIPGEAFAVESILKLTRLMKQISSTPIPADR